MNDIKTLEEELLEERERISDLITIYESYGPERKVDAMMMKQSLAIAGIAIANGDVIAIIKALDDLRSY